MSRNIKLQVSFDGTNYSGWQRQNNGSTIQGTIEKCLSTMTRHQVNLHGAGRTDAGVHALAMTANFKTDTAIPPAGISAGLNSMLPTDIRILSADEVPDDFHSRYNATGKTYSYAFFTGAVQQPTERLYCTHFPGPLNEKMIRQALKHIQGTHDFSSFEGSGSRDTSRMTGRGAVRTIYTCELIRYPGNRDSWSLRFTGDGFLRHMVRNLVGTLFEVGRSKISPDEFHAIMKGRDRAMAGPTAPACGLFLEKVWYSPINC